MQSMPRPHALSAALGVLCRLGSMLKVIVPLLFFIAPAAGQQYNLNELNLGAKQTGDDLPAKLSGGLLALDAASQSRDIAAVSAIAARAVIELRDNRALVTIFLEENVDPEEIGDFVGSLGGQAASVFSRCLEVWMPIDQLSRLRDDNRIRFVCQSPTLSAFGVGPEIVSEGAETIGVSRLHDAGIVGQGVTVGILDSGFADLDAALSAGEVPAGSPIRSFTGSGPEQAQCSNHGTLCAEIIHDMAPGARLVLAQVSHLSDIIQAVDWFRQEGVEIVSLSSGFFCGPFDGRALFDRVVDNSTMQFRMTWIVAAGNAAKSHWAGNFVDNDGDGLNEFAPGDEGLDLVAEESGVAVHVSWDDWGEGPELPSSRQDYDIYLLDGNNRLLAKSDSVQNGNQLPLESLSSGQLAAGDRLFLLIGASGATRPVKFHVFVQGAVVLPSVSAGSITNPGTAVTALTVGAAGWRDMKAEPYSSRGPTDDGRNKPEVSAPDGISTMTLGGTSFFGTSASAPHATGFAALLCQLHGHPAPATLRDVVQRFVIDRGAEGLDPIYGAGFISAEGIGIPYDPRPAERPSNAVEVSDSLLASIDDLRRRDPLQTALDRLAAISEEGDLEIRMAANHRGNSPRYRFGDRLKIGFSVNRECLVLLLHRDPNGAWNTLIPGNGSLLLQVGPGQVILFPPLGQRGLKVGPPAGIDRFYCIAVCEKVDLGDLLSGNTDALAGKAAAAALEIETQQ